MMNIVQYIDGPFIKAMQTSLIDRQASTHKFCYEKEVEREGDDENFLFRLCRKVKCVKKFQS